MIEGESLEGKRRWLGVLALCAAIFFADASHSAVIPTFPSFALALGASLTVVGALASASGISRTLCSVPLGSISDRFGRRQVMLLGFLCFVATPLIYTVSSSPLHLLPARIILGVAMVSTFSLGFVYISELAAPQHRGVAQGLYMTAMGLGFTLGPLVGGITANTWGYSSSFYLSSGLAMVGLLILLIVRNKESRKRDIPRRGSSKGGSADFGAVLADPRVMAAGVANFLNSMLFSALIIFFPLYGRHIGFNESQVGFCFTVRGLSSTAIRFPTGAATKRMSILRLMTIGLGVSALTLLVLTSFNDILVICLILGVQGIAYGIYLTAGNAYVTEEAPAEMRGTAIGIYSTFSNISGVISPLILGAIAEKWSLQAAFQVSGVLALAGMAMMLALARKEERTEGQ